MMRNDHVNRPRDTSVLITSRTRASEFAEFPRQRDEHIVLFRFHGVELDTEFAAVAGHFAASVAGHTAHRVDDAKLWLVANAEGNLTREGAVHSRRLFFQEEARSLRHVLVSAAAEVRDDELVTRHFWRGLDHASDRMSAFQRGMIPSQRLSLAKASSASSSVA
jgi:hypothetical protein